MKMNYHLSTSSYTASMLSCTVLDDDIRYEKLSWKLDEAEMQGLMM
ncbi:hypothetical protein H817_YJM1419M00304 [Saccharomyces cerevisiae YJM1419]|nr:hypothetical protein H749_YJM195M00304 [Saccharomyces cerevisiae YJM195]AJS77764.1 hypothetical protein H782_YJM1190M00304 [Saccharomyces cerevisiae YJM1190]AJS78623.1 hypothetical protein H784_YJM1202M00293 [Saccharomyces cerevisiae YJM1202]AJS80373.1 hypothetical protein H788_YJM1248M00304 [Saccharomyces cerevisiae YJM1248]AJS85590.1 hypothetical protein H800_YJM1342M00304 [Saccharomyces cerevisiae YJM1342]AJS87336.1 hypothetical protein H804_YJM1383M00304 [Saccharomyces cerevisiae YJM138